MMTSSATKRKLLALLFLLSFLFPSSKGRADLAKEPPLNSGALIVSKVTSLSELISSDQPYLSDTLRILGGKVSDTGSKRGIVATGDHYKAVVNFKKDQGKELVSEVLIYLDAELGVRFKDLKEILGEWKTVHQSKTSSVLFKYSNPKSGKKALIYVHMNFPPRDADSPVFLIDIRREISFSGKRK